MHDQRRSPATESRRPRLIAAIAVVALLGGCAGSPDNTTRLREQAHLALERWAAAVAAAGGPAAVVPVGDLTGQVGDWEVAVGSNNKIALMNGMVEAGVGIPAAVPPDGVVTWPDGTTSTVKLVSAARAVKDIGANAPAPCGDCTALQVTDARLTTGPIATTRGPAMGPIWEFGVQGTAVKVTRVAIANAITVQPLPWNPNDPPVGLSIDSASGSVGGRELTVSFVGSPRRGDQPCGEDYSAEAVESDLAVVVIVLRHPHLGGLGGCTAEGATRTATVELADLLGARAVLSVQSGTPVSVALAP